MDDMDRDRVTSIVAEAFCQPVEILDGSPGAVGLEVEQFLMTLRPDGTPGARLSMDGLVGLLDLHPQATPEVPSATGLTGWALADGSRLVPEPGAQLEHAGRPHRTAADAITGAQQALRELAGHAEAHGVVTVSAGLDPFHLPEHTPQALRCPRYPAMHRYLTRRSPHGHVMMTGTASVQVNLDLGTDPDVATARWAAALLVSPLATATFACSPTPGAVNGRAVVWQWLDPSRTGVPRSFVDGEDDPVRAMTDQALSADVLLFGSGTTVVAGEPGFTFGRWLDEGHPQHGRPGRADLLTHLTTLFPEVRARGFLELRSVDALPERWRAVPVVLYCGLLYDRQARERARELMEVERADLPELLRRAAHLGLADPRLCALAVEVWTTAAEGARRLPDGFLDPADISRAERFIDTFTMRGRSPSDELRERLTEGPAAALRWAREPAVSVHLC